jgi:hypothetical protein
MAETGLETIIQQKFQQLEPYLNEKALRLWAATEALALGRGGVSLLAQTTGLSRTTIHTGLRELRQPAPAPSAAVRAAGGGRKTVTETDPTLLRDLESLLEPVTHGDPESPLWWTCKSTTKLAAELRALNHCVSQRTVYNLLRQLDYSLQSNRKNREGAQHPERNAQFQYIATLVKELQAANQPVISVDTKKKETIGDFHNKGREWARRGRAPQVRVHDFPDPQLGKVIPYGVYDLTANRGWVSVGIDHDTAAFAVATIRRWWAVLGRDLYPQAQQLLVTADGGGSNGSRVRLWKVELQKLADETGLTIRVCHFPPGTSKWNKIEHRMFCHISQNWRGRPLTSRAAVVELIRHTTTTRGLEIRAELEEGVYPTGVKVSEEELQAVLLERDAFHGEWNYKIKPRAAN